MDFFERLESIIETRDSVLCIGLDPAFSAEEIAAKGKHACADQALERNVRIIEATADCVAAYKPNIAFYEALGDAGMAALRKTLDSIPKEIPIIIDAKRGDISSTAAAYAHALFGELHADAVTLNPYLGLDTLDPFLEWKGKGIFVLCRTSNPGAGFLQDIIIDGKPLYIEVAKRCAALQKKAGLVVAGNDLEALRKVRAVAPSQWFLSPGIGAQGGQADLAFAAGARDDGKGILVVAARSIADASDPAKAAVSLRDAMRTARDTMLKQNKTENIQVAAPAAKAAQKAIDDLKKAFVDALLSTGCFRLGEFTLKSGKKSPFYIDLRKLVSDPRAMKIAAQAYASLASECEYDRIAGIPAAGLPLATAASIEIGKPMIWPRMPVKEHGTGNRVEGEFRAGEHILLLDDLITTGASKIEAIDILRSEGLIVQDLVVLIERGAQGRQDMGSAGVNLRAFIHVKELFDVLLQNGTIDSRKYEQLMEYVAQE
ncbi:MAG TPA: orotate phosphoribosyltransferase [Spirochaetaceae bacterium]|nr:orotate phosphoribosyltransferase [Spirochaetaceae bacterium]